MGLEIGLIWRIIQTVVDLFCLLGDELYAGVATDLMGRDFTIFRSLGKRPSIRTEQHDSRWLNGALLSFFFLSDYVLRRLTWRITLCW